LDVIGQLQKEVELQASNYVSAKINYYFKDSHVSRGNTLADLNLNYANFTSEIKIQEWYDERLKELDIIIKNRDYSIVLSVFNNKGLRALANKHLKILDFTDKALKLLQFQPDTHDILRKHFPQELVNNNVL
jgi:hypothetical protein